jgi:hypothetical protein
MPIGEFTDACCQALELAFSTPLIRPALLACKGSDCPFANPPADATEPPPVPPLLLPACVAPWPFPLPFPPALLASASS